MLDHDRRCSAVTLLYNPGLCPDCRPMITRAYHASLFALYQLCIAVGIVLMPLALAANRAGVSIPIHKLLASVGEALENASQPASTR